MMSGNHVLLDKGQVTAEEMVQVGQQHLSGTELRKNVKICQVEDGF